MNNLPEIFYGRHFAPGVAEYKNRDKTMRVYINEATAKKMDPSMAGKPVVVDHIEELPDTAEGIKQIADGYVSESFYVPEDGNHWAKFVAVTNKAKKAIEDGWALSNAYTPTEFGQGGKHHAVDYDKEILNGEYEHLAIVQNPRYENSRILKPEEFKAYVAEKRKEIARLANSKEPTKQGAKSVLNIFKRTKVENSADFDEMMVRLPKSGKEMTLTQLVNEQDKFCNAEGYANPDHLVKVGNEEMSVKEMADCYGKMKSDMDAMKNKMSEMEAKEKEKKENEPAGEAESAGKKEMKEGKPDPEVKKVEEEEKKMNSAYIKEFERFKNKVETSSAVPLADASSRIVLPQEGVKRGMANYGVPANQR